MGNHRKRQKIRNKWLNLFQRRLTELEANNHTDGQKDGQEELHPIQKEIYKDALKSIIEDLQGGE